METELHQFSKFVLIVLLTPQDLYLLCIYSIRATKFCQCQYQSNSFKQNKHYLIPNMTANTSLLLLCIYTIFLKVSGTPLPIEGKKTKNSKNYFKWLFKQKKKIVNLTHLINHYDGILNLNYLPILQKMCIKF